MDFLTPNLINQCNELMHIPFNTFKEQILIYQTPEQNYISTDVNTFNFVFQGQNQPNENFQNITRSGIYYATVEFEKNRDGMRLAHSPEANPLQIPNGFVRICVSGSEAGNFLKSCEKIVLDGENFNIESDKVNRGLFTRDYFSFWLKRLD